MKTPSPKQPKKEQEAEDVPHFLTLSTDEEKKQWSLAEYADFCKVDPEDGLDFSGKTSMWVAYERDLESKREDALFNDHLAKYFVEPYGKRLSTMFMLGLTPWFDPDGEVGFNWRGHINYTAARTQLINDRLTDWLKSKQKDEEEVKRLQVLNLGAGVDTRAFWLQSLKDVADSCCYIEVDTEPVLKFKKKRMELARSEAGVEATTPLCDRKVITLDFSKESVQDLPTHGFDASIPTFWILEGLLMYLSQEAVDQLLKELSDLSSSAKGSYLMINYSANTPVCQPADLDSKLEAMGWEKTEQLFFGEEPFAYGKYPKGKPVNKVVGFSMYKN